MIRHILRLEAVMPALSRATFSRLAPHPPRDASNAPSASGGNVQFLAHFDSGIASR